LAVARRRSGERLGEAGRPEQVDLHGGVERCVEAHRGRRVDDHVTAGEERPSVRVEAKPLLPDVPGDDAEPPRGLGVEAVAELGPQAIEAVVAQDLPLQAVGGAGPPAGRTRTATSQSGTVLSSRSTSAVPRKPVAPVTAMRLPLRASPITAPL